MGYDWAVLAHSASEAHVGRGSGKAVRERAAPYLRFQRPIIASETGAMKRTQSGSRISPVFFFFSFVYGGTEL